MATALPASSLRRHFERAVEEARRDGIEGALLASRHGVPLAVVGDLSEIEGFAAMHATALGAAEAAFARLGMHTDVSLVAETDGRRFVSRAIDSSLFVVALVTPDADCREVLDWMGGLPGKLR